jgi:two-component system KDP operon response regulator KdpE
MSNKFTVLIVEDEDSVAGFLSAILTANDYNVIKAKNGAEALMMSTSYCPDIILLDLGLPDIDGIQIIKKVRSWSSVPIIVVSGRTHERDKVEALDSGADDYVTKPFGTSELLARVRTALRHIKNRGDRQNQPRLFKAGGFVIDYNKRHCYIDGEDIHLTQTEYNIVALLSQYAGSVMTYDHLIKEIWGPNTDGDNQILRVNMANIRRKIEKNPSEPRYIFTEMGVGYRMIESD